MSHTVSPRVRWWEIRWVRKSPRTAKTGYKIPVCVLIADGDAWEFQIVIIVNVDVAVGRKLKVMMDVTYRLIAKYGDVNQNARQPNYSDEHQIDSVLE